VIELADGPVTTKLNEVEVGTSMAPELL